MIGKDDYLTSKKGIIFRYNGTFDLDKMYKDTKSWFDDFNYDFDEKEYKEKRQAHGDEIKIDLLAERKVDDYAKFHINVNFLILNVKKLDKKNYIGDVKVNVVSYVELDYNNNWQYGKLKKYLFFIYNNILIKNKIENVYEEKLFTELASFENVIKQHLGLI